MAEEDDAPPGAAPDVLPEAPRRPYKRRRPAPTGITHNALNDVQKRDVRLQLDGMLRETGEAGIFEYVEPGMNDELAANALSKTLGFTVVKTNVVRIRLVEGWKLNEPKAPKAPKGRSALSPEQAELLSQLPFVVEELGKLAESIKLFRRDTARVEGWKQVIPQLEQKVSKLEAEVVRLDKAKAAKVGSEALAASYATEAGNNRLKFLNRKREERELRLAKLTRSSSTPVKPGK